ncbi:polar amino acid transport system permease protein [Mycoplana sp. BE70]|uniref:amino acid ABC transporter permease/ATP-binding protein n=1 Tax=Mycoplana sp. BE70 TaxID=2817775 RepID=UPI00285D5B49|nr:amino acid ABC transporter permease/ATP-binding protein [Mycoplana sp. BE70]MDR6759172.1 polar amino acid transport system permease protein [Mycoplana sp. BE70]
MEFDWNYTVSLLASKDFWNATLLVAELSLAAGILSIFFGFLVALCRLSAKTYLRIPSLFYVWFFRSLPTLVLIIFVYNMPQVFPSTGYLLSTPFITGLVALVLSETAYMSEIHRGALQSINKGQREAGRTLGIGAYGIQRLIIIPQALRIALPSLGNQMVTIVKLTSLVSAISLTEILLVGQRLYTQNFMVLETMLAVAAFYIFIVTIFDLSLKFLERRLDLTKRSAKLYCGKAPVLMAENGKYRNDAKATIALELKDGVKTFGNHTVLDSIDLKVMQGEVISIIGPSGSGKTTLIRCLNGLEILDKGFVFLNNKPFLSGAKESSKHPKPSIEQIVDVGMVFQNFNLFPHLTAIDNVLLAPSYHARNTKAEREAFASSLLQSVGMLSHKNKYPHQLSGGQQQRVAIARSLALEPSVLLFDEPTSALDPETVGEVLKIMEDLAKSGRTMIIVTHEMNFAMKVSSRLIFMNGGKIAFDGDPKSLDRSRPEYERVLNFMTANA